MMKERNGAGKGRFCAKCSGPWFEDHSCLVFRRKYELFKERMKTS